jgi:hypothetical protein
VQAGLLCTFESTLRYLEVILLRDPISGEREARDNGDLARGPHAPQPIGSASRLPM